MYDENKSLNDHNKNQKNVKRNQINNIVQRVYSINSNKELSFGQNRSNKGVSRSKLHST
jgi:hypothetical protein